MCNLRKNNEEKIFSTEIKVCRRKVLIVFILFAYLTMCYALFAYSFDHMMHKTIGHCLRLKQKNSKSSFATNLDRTKQPRLM